MPNSGAFPPLLISDGWIPPQSRSYYLSQPKKLIRSVDEGGYRRASESFVDA